MPKFTASTAVAAVLKNYVTFSRIEQAAGEKRRSYEDRGDAGWLRLGFIKGLPRFGPAPHRVSLRRAAEMILHWVRSRGRLQPSLLSTLTRPRPL
jgi:hypothetical protein